MVSSGLRILPRCAGLTLAGSLVAGCVTVTEPVQVGENEYMIGLGARGGFETDAELLAKSIKAAGEFCASRHATIEVVRTTAKGVQMWTPQSNEVYFKCIVVAAQHDGSS